MIALWFVVAVAALLGLAVGSFLNVVAYRLPRGESLLFPPSHCTSCDTAIKRRHNVPVLGWLMLHGRCAHCAAPISVRYPLVEAATGLVFALAAAGMWPIALIALLAGLVPGAFLIARRADQNSERHAVARPSISNQPREGATSWLR